MENLIDFDSFQELLDDFSFQGLLYTHFGVWYAEGTLDYLSFRKLSEYFGVYQYIFPAQRDNLIELSDWLYQNRTYNLFALALLVHELGVNFSLEQQLLILELLKARKERRMEKSPKNHAILPPSTRKLAV